MFNFIKRIIERRKMRKKLKIKEKRLKSVLGIKE